VGLIGGVSCQLRERPRRFEVNPKHPPDIHLHTSGPKLMCGSESITQKY
jgi:hypothetical protein